MSENNVVRFNSRRSHYREVESPYHLTEKRDVEHLQLEVKNMIRGHVKRALNTEDFLEVNEMTRSLLEDKPKEAFQELDLKAMDESQKKNLAFVIILGIVHERLGEQADLSTTAVASIAQGSVAAFLSEAKREGWDWVQAEDLLSFEEAVRAEIDYKACEISGHHGRLLL